MGESEVSSLVSSFGGFIVGFIIHQSEVSSFKVSSFHRFIVEVKS